MNAFTPAEPLASRWTRTFSGHRRWPLLSIALAAVASALVVLPLVFLIVQAQQSGWRALERLLLRHEVAVLLWNTVRLTLACTALCAVIGVGTAWCVQRAALPAGACGRWRWSCPSGSPTS